MAHSTKTLLDEVLSITECPICQEIMTTPKVLPCLHTFCLKCIQQHGKECQEGDSILCPMCRTNFTVPCGGMSGLKNNFFIEKLIVSQTSSNIGRDGTKCDVCFAWKPRKESATMFCVECQENLCEQCLLIHSNMKLTKSHEIQSLTANSESMESPKETCELHDADIEHYCKTCEAAVCGKCVAENHEKHECSDIMETIKQIKQSLKSNCDLVSACELDLRKQSENAEEMFRLFIKSDDKSRTEIENRGRQLKQLIDVHVTEVLEKLDFMGSKLKKEFQNMKEDLQRKRIVMVNFVQYSTELLNKASPVDIIRVAEEMKSKAKELKKSSVTSFDKFLEMNFIPSDFKIQKDKISSITNIIGRIRVVHQLGKSVQGLTTSNTSLCVLYNKSPDIELYDTETLAFQKTIHVPGLYNACDIVHSDDLLFVSDDDDHLMHKIEIPGGTVVHKWKITGKSLKLSIAQRDRLVVSSCDPIEITEYTFKGEQCRKIKVTDEFCGLYHTTFLKENVYLACLAKSSTSDSPVYVVTQNTNPYTRGEIVLLGNSKSFNVPSYLKIDKNNFVVVADRSSISKLDPSNLAIVEVILPSFVGLKRPHTFCLHEEVNRLFVCDCSNSNKISMFDYNK